jgi:stalled ribosome alternative rescue factor ArfA
MNTYSHMKTTVEIPDAVLKEARRVATKERTTVRALIVDGLRRVLAERKRKGKFQLRKASFKGSGLHPDLAGAPWEKIRDTIYESRGA